MKKHDPRGRSTYDTPHYRLHRWLSQTDAWKALNGNEKAIYCDIGTRYLGPGKNNGAIPYSVREAATCARVGKSTAAKCLLRLQELGFIVAAQNGAFDWKAKKCTEWRMTEFACDATGDLPTKEFARWRSGDSFLIAKKQNTVRPQVQGVPEAGQAVPEAGHMSHPRTRKTIPNYQGCTPHGTVAA
jgi:hypothetical protein